MEEFYKIRIGNCERLLPLIKGDKFSYYSFNMLGDTELNKEAAKQLASMLSDTDVVLTVESKAIALAQEVSSILNHPKYIVVRKSRKSYMKGEVSVSGNTIISGNTSYFLDGQDIEYLKGKKIAIVDDVISTCGTIDAIYRLFSKCGLEIYKIACVLCEGTITKDFNGVKVESCGFIPLLENDK